MKERKQERNAFLIQDKDTGEKQLSEEHTRLVIDEDSIYEIDLDCLECMKKIGQNRKK